jgi:hypothetical protein
MPSVSKTIFLQVSSKCVANWFASMSLVCYKCVTSVLQVCYKCVTSVLQVCYKCVTSVLQVCYKCVTCVATSPLHYPAAAAVAVLDIWMAPFSTLLWTECVRAIQERLKIQEHSESNNKKDKSDWNNEHMN